MGAHTHGMSERKSTGPGIDADDPAIEEVRAALVRAIIDAGSEGTLLDAEDQGVLERYGTGKISRSEMMAFFEQMAARIEFQIRSPQ
jgi:hypothetical protein